ncbi:periostin-like isoform X1 [Ostrea edulis]|uniref:periostin-like isoform X1 n=1 Tax=Ostrea edulis TaxID=37623 RepID=UPI0024AF1FAA|nr:periostin-like isoform X1 [Ostrea edulis]
MLRRACFIFVLVILSSECEARGPQWDIYDLLDALGLKSFSGLLESTGYMYKLSDNASGPFTVFAPSEEAFSNLPPSVVKKLQHDGNWDLLHDLTSFHITRGNFSYFNWTNNMIIPTSLEGSSLRLNIYNNKSGEPSVMSACGATLIKGDQVATNGIVQIIDRVLYRYPGDSLPNYIQQNSKLRTLAMLMQIDGYQDKLNGQNITFFAPSDSAFNETGRNLTDIFSNTTLIEEIFRNHTVSNTFYTNGLQILDGGFVINNSGAKISIKVDEDIYLNGVKISEEDIPLSNGVLHIVNRMLFPLHNQE